MKHWGGGSSHDGRKWFSYLQLGPILQAAQQNIHQFHPKDQKKLLAPETNGSHLKHWGWKMSFPSGMA